VKNHFDFPQSRVGVQTQNNLVVSTIKDFAALKGFSSVAPTVRVNTNGYPFITFIDEKNVAENIYFSKAASAKVDVGMPVDKALLAQHQIAITKNEAGEDRIKLISNSERIALSDLF